MTSKVDLSRIPEHIAVIMDGNGRWAAKRGLPRIMGHRAGVKTVKEIVKACSGLGVKVLTLYAFSTENWLRPKSEVSGLMSILKVFLKKELSSLIENNVRFQTIGVVEGLPVQVREVLAETKRNTCGNTGLILNIAINYGGRQEIIDAVNRLIKSGAREADSEVFKEYLYTSSLPDPDLLIRTSGEMRISNFLLWQIAYTEFYVTDVLWPDFKEKNLIEAIIDYQKRDRRFGGVAAKGSISARRNADQKVF